MKKQELHPRTAIINKQQKIKAKKARNEALQWLAQHFPQAFDNTTKIQPLKLGIMEDILIHAHTALAAGISKSKLRQAVVVYTRRIDYLACLKAREMRIDLTGAPVTPVTEEEAARAALKIKKHVEKSAKNAKKMLSQKSVIPDYKDGGFKTFLSHAEEGISVENASPKQATVVVKHKAARAYDPNVVARLKEKLGLKKNVEKIDK